MRSNAALRFFAFQTVLLFCSSLGAQNQAANLSPPVPTTKVLAIGTVEVPLSPDQRKSIMSREVPETVELYLKGKIDQWYVRKDNKGVVFLMNVTSEEEAHALLERLPLGQAKLMKFELIELGPLNPLRLLLPASK